MSAVSGLTSSNVAAYAATTRARGAAAPDGDGDGRVHHGHRGQAPGGDMARQLMAALQSLGLNVPASGNSDKAAATTTAATTTATTEDSGTTEGGAKGGSQAPTLHDLHEFMHQLFAAAREAEGGDAKGNNGHGIGYGKGGRPGFGQGLAALISEVSGGNAPAGLQSAFDKLTANSGAGSGDASSDASGDASGNASVSLQALLTKLQGNLGYAVAGTTDTTGATGTTGNVVNAVA